MGYQVNEVIKQDNYVSFKISTGNYLFLKIKIYCHI